MPARGDLIAVRFSADAPNRLWLEHWTAEGKLYLCPVKEVFSNQIVGYSINFAGELPSGRHRAPDSAVARRRIDSKDTAGCVFTPTAARNFDQGSCSVR